MNVTGVVPTYIFNTGLSNSISASNSISNSNNFAARPLKHWRKQLQTQNGLARHAVSMGMPMDIPGSVTITNDQCITCKDTAELTETIIKNNKDASYCKPTNRQSLTYTDNAAYLQSRCVTYVQKMATNLAPDIDYFLPSGICIEPSDSPSGSQIRETNNCYGQTNAQNAVVQAVASKCATTIYKPNNVPFAQQGGVSSSSRLARLKYNTLNNSGAAFQSASGAVGFNTGRYKTEPSPSYYNKLKPQKVVYPVKTGARVSCNNTICMFE